LLRLERELDRRGFSSDTAVGVVAFTAAVIVALASYAYIRLDPTGASSILGLLIGSIVALRPSDVALLATLSTAILVVLYVFWREIVYVYFDSEWSLVSGVRVYAYKLLFYALVATASLALTYTVGVLLAHIVLVAPGVGATRLAGSVGRIEALSIAGSIASMEAGLLLSWATGWPPAGGVGVVLGLGFGVAWLYRRLMRSAGSGGGS